MLNGQQRRKNIEECQKGKFELDDDDKDFFSLLGMLNEIDKLNLS